MGRWRNDLPRVERAGEPSGPFPAQLGVSRETPVAVCVERSWQMVAGVLGILKAGGAYVPLEPDYPSERLALMLADTEAPILLCTPTLASSWGEYAGRIVGLEKEDDWFANYGEANPQCASQAGDLAYVMYTSGSTGTPKSEHPASWNRTPRPKY